MHLRLSCLVLVVSAVVLASSLQEARAQEASETPLVVRSLPSDQVMLYLNEKGEQRPVKSVDDWQLRRKLVIQGMQSVMGELPGDEKRCALDLKVEESVDRGSYVQQFITYQSEPGSRVPAYLLIPKSALADAENGKATQKFRGALCLHPTHAQGPKGCVGVLDVKNRQYGQELAERGYVVLAPNYPHLGKYAPDLKGLGWKSGTLKAVWDNIRGLDLLESLPYVKKGSFAAIGHSLGGHNSVYTAVFDDRVKVIVSSCGLDSYVDYYNGKLDNWRHGRGWAQDRYMPRMALYAGKLDQIPFDFHEMIAVLSPRPVLIVAPLQDSNFRHESVDRVVAAAKPVFELYGVADRLQVEHPDVMHDFPPEMRERSYKFIDAALE